MVFTMKNEADLLQLEKAKPYWRPRKCDTVGARIDFNDKHKILTIVTDLKGHKLRRCKKTAEMYVWSTDTWSIKDYRKKYGYVWDYYDNDTIDVVVAYDGVDLIWDEERKCAYAPDRK